MYDQANVTVVRRAWSIRRPGKGSKGFCEDTRFFSKNLGPETPMSMFSPSFVSSLDDDELEEIAGEDTTARRRRSQLKKEVHELEAGRKICPCMRTVVT
ncbi:hypothetical protein GB937_010828 [Aspergillus fischeri]|nr:hypothetical protein GB937_010828 [Aspergillus fischeri]